MSKLRWPLLRLGVAGWLLVGIPACTQEVAAESARLPSRAEDDAQNQELAAKYAQEVATESDRLTAEQGDADAQALLGVVYCQRSARRRAGLRGSGSAGRNGRGSPPNRETPATRQSLLGAAYYAANRMTRGAGLQGREQPAGLSSPPNRGSGNAVPRQALLRGGVLERERRAPAERPTSPPTCELPPSLHLTARFRDPAVWASPSSSQRS